ncbi:plasmid partition protein [Embleya sp. NPDC020886]|uniref:nucleotide-binding protein n=1 Tax=Embleya sp. NPDC020886 TaxID=3363980 RepID=UPI0037A1DB42
MFVAAISPRSTGKTTAIAWLLHALHERGYPVTGYDADESEQLTRWHEGRVSGSYPFEVHTMATSRFHEQAPKVLPPGHIGAVDVGHLENHASIGWSVLRVADLAIVACAPTASDVERLDELPMDHFIQQIAPKRPDRSAPPTWVLLMRAQPNTRAPQEYRASLQESGWNVFSTVIPAIQLYAGTGDGVPVRAAGTHFDELVTEMESRGLIGR